MELWQAIAIALMYYISDSPWPIGMGYWVLQRPLVAGFIAGVILGDPVTGTIIGATMNLIYLGHITAGGTMPGDMALAGYLGTALAITSGLDAQAALALAVPLGLLGTVVWFTRMSISSIFVHWADKYAEEGNIRGVMLMNFVPAQILLFVIKVPTLLIACLYGPDLVKGVLDFLGADILHALMVIGGILPALGIALNLRAILKGSTIPYFFLGFALSVYLKLDIVAVSIFGAILAFLHIQFTRGGENRGISA
ncbi:PTS mannose/fructose/sorbose/N-acetylgalactosamine transporter subunit IIC [Zhaonella formicivorans]|uniref:PTS mannose/fructose/sorbose/N-acetylgalactosamine transporter subunit IIC n=1 Tax=Zhaonella formicivorans TaxID=2528593 RepID=UPI0010DEB899|nr:PTS sugar transporter subunit IIC [Zhaonella formicivorans]